MDRGSRPSTAPARSAERVTSLLRAHFMSTARTVRSWKDEQTLVAKPTVAELTSVQNWMRSRNLRGAHQLTFIEEQNIRRLFRVLDASGEGKVPLLIVEALLGALEPGLWKRPKKTTSMASMIDEADFVAIMARHRDSIEVGSPMLPIDISISAAYREYELSKMAAMARAVTEDLKLLSSRVSGRRDYDHTWGRDNPTCMRLYSAPTSKTALSGSGSAGTAVDGIPGSSIREKPQGGPSNGGSCAYLGRGPDGALVWRYWSPPSHRNVIRPIRSLRTSISSGEIHLLYGNAEVYVFNPHELRFQCITFLPGEEGRLRYKWTSSARTMSALYTTSNPRSASRGIYWSLPLKYDVTRPSIAQAGSVIQQSLIPPTRIACSSEVASHCCDGNVVKAAESANSVYWLLSSGIVLHATDRHLLPRVKPEGLVLESMPMTDLARRFSRITEADARTLVNDSVLAPLVRLLRIPYKVRTIAAGWKHALFVLCEEDRVFGIGDSSLGQLGLGDQQLYAAVPTEVSNLRSKAVKNVACGGVFSLCLCRDGSVLSFGSGHRGQLGCGGDVKLSRIPLCLPLPDRAFLIACGPETACAFTASSNLFVWGVFPQLQAGMVEIPIVHGLEAPLRRDIRATTNVTSVFDHFVPRGVLTKESSLLSRRSIDRIAITHSSLFLAFTAYKD